jgi:hypothetical protein
MRGTFNLREIRCLVLCFGKPVMKYGILIGAAAATFLGATSASAFFLTEGDYAYLATQNFVRSESIFQNLGPREEARLHALINDLQTENAPAVRAKIVTDTLREFMDHRLWEKAHPGQIWDSLQPGG